MRRLQFILGIAVLLMGAVWIGQGTGYFPYPSMSFMIRKTEWAYIGGVLAIIGLALIWRSRSR